LATIFNVRKSSVPNLLKSA